MKSAKLCFKVFFIFIVALFLVSSCNKSDDTIVINMFSFDNIVYETSHGRILNQGVLDKTGYFSIVLMSTELDNRTNGYEGQGDLVSFLLLSSDSTKILPGIYDFDKNTLGDKNNCDNVLGTRQPNTSIQIGIALNYKVATDGTVMGCDFWGWAEEGNVTINSIENGVYDIDYNFKIYDGRIVTGHYKGVIQNHEQ
jgi:hypothetical protein